MAAFGGSLGARRINRAVAELARRCGRIGADARRSTTWPAGATTSEFGAVAGGDGAERRRGGLCYRVVPFEDRMPELYRAADVCVRRAGAMTVAELLVAGVPAILVPLPGRPATTRRATPRRWWRRAPRCSCPTPSATAERLADELDALLSDPGRLAAMAGGGAAHGHPDAAARVAELVDAHAR